MEEILCSIHNYTKFSGNGISFYDLAQSALSCGLDAVFVTDRNVYPQGHDQYYYKEGKRLLLYCGEELFDPLNEGAGHYLSIGIEREQFNLKIFEPANEIRIRTDMTNDAGPFRFVEIMNAQDLLSKDLSEGLNKTTERLKLLDAQMGTGFRVTVVAGTCSYALLNDKKHSYAELFSTVMNHIYTKEPFTGELRHDKDLVMRSMRNGNLYCAIDGLCDAKGFMFSAEGETPEDTAFPGDSIHMKNSVTFKNQTPAECTCRLFRNGECVREWHRCRQVPYNVYEPGVYRVECHLVRRNREYLWICSNPIYVLRG